MPRASKGRGTVLHRVARQRYEAVLVVDGRKHTRSVTYATARDAGRAKRAAEKALDELRARYLGPGAHSDETLSTYTERWLAFVEPELRNTTYVSYSGVMANHVLPYLGKRRIEDLTVADVDSWLALLAKDGRSGQVRQRARKVLGRAMQQAVSWELVDTNPVRASTTPRVANVERETLSPAQARTFLDSVREDRLEALWLLGACLGLRSGEVRGLRWSDIVDGTVRVERTLAYEQLPDGSHAYRLAETKTPRARRTLPLPTFVAEALQRRREGQRFEAQTPGWDNPWDLVFTSRYTGDPLSAFGVMTRLKSLLASADLPVVSFHQLRHAAASLLLAQGLPPRAVQDILGHASPTMTLGVYAHSDSEQRREVARALEAWRA